MGMLILSCTKYLIGEGRSSQRAEKRGVDRFRGTGRGDLSPTNYDESVERGHFLLRCRGHGVLGGVEDGTSTAAVELMGLQGDLGGDGDPVAGLEGDRS